MILKFHNAINIHLIIVLVVFVFSSVASQNIYDLENSKKYAEYLLLSNQFKLAAEEYERLVFLEPDNQEYKIKLLRSYRKSGNLGLAINRVYGLNKGSVYNLSRGLSVEYLSSLVFADSLSGISIFLKNNSTLNDKDKLIFTCSTKLLSGEYRYSKSFCESQFQNKELLPEELKIIVSNALKRKFKSPILAGGLSTVIPGLGKVYTKNYMDGIMSFIFIAGSAWQSYKGFQNKGINSISGWVFGGISLGFYLGNIYGSAKAAKRYNRLKLNETNNEVYNFIQHYSF